MDHQLEFGRQHHRQVGRFLALENPSGIDAGLAVCIGDTRLVAHQPTDFGKKATGRIDPGKRMAGRQRDDAFPMGVRERAGADKQRAPPSDKGWPE